MAERAADYAIPVDGRTWPTPCGPGHVLHAEYDVIDDEPERLAPQRFVFLWVHQLNHAVAGPRRTRKFTVVASGNPWPPTATHVASVRGHDDHGLAATLHVLEVLT